MAENSWIEATPVTATSSTEGWVEASAIPEKEPETSWMGAIKPVPALVASGMVKAGAGIADIIGASDTAKGWRESANVVDKQIQAELPVDETSWKGATRNALTSMGTQALPIAAGVLTGGAAVPLMGMGAIAGAQKMSDLTEAGVGYGKALPASILSGGVEVVTEKIPFTSFLRLLKGKSGVASAITKMMISEQLGEQAANMSDQVIDQLKPDETWSWDKFKSSVIATAKATLVQSGMMGAGGAAVGKVASRRDRTTTALPTPESQIEQTVLPPVPATNEGRRQKRLNRNIATDLVKKQEEQKLFIEALDAEKQDTAEGNLIIAEEPVVLKDAGQREFVEAKVAELGSVAEVDKLYKGKSDVEVYAREKARELFPVQEEAIDYKAEAEKYGVDYNGMQEVPSGMQPFPLFTMKEGIETTFTLEAGETLPQAIARKQKQAAEAGTDQTSVQNMNKGATTIEELSPERIANMERLHDIAQKYALERAQHKLDVETLKREEWSDAAIKEMGPEEVARKASVIRGDLDVSGTSELNINKMSEIEKQTMDIAERRARGEEIPEAELDDLIAKMSDTEGVPITDIFTRSTYFDQIDPDTGLSPSLAEFEKRVAAVRAGFDRALRKRKPVVSEVDQKVATRRREKIKTEIAETLEETKPDVDYEKLLADEGMPAELEFASQGGTQKSAKQQSLSAKVKFDKTMSLTRAFTSDREARNTMVQGYKFRPETLVEAKKHLQSLIRAEQMAEPHIKSKRVAFDSKVIAKALREKVITKEQAKYIETILSTLKQQPDFTLKLDPTLDMQFGIYALADNLMTLKSEKATAHEVMHWAFYNVLTGQERVAYYREYMNQFYNKAGNFRAIKARTVTSDFYNASKSPAEMFAARGSDIANGYKLTATERSLFQKTIDWFKGLSAKLSKKLGVDLGKIDRLYDKVMDDSARKVWDDAEDVRVSAGEINAEIDSMGIPSLMNQIREKVKQYKLSRENRGAGILAEVKGTDDISRGVFIASDKPKPRPVGPYFRSPMEFVKDTINEKHVYNLNRAEQFIASKFDQHRAEIRVAQEGLSKEEKKNIRLVLEKKIDGSIKEQEAAGKVRVWLDSMKAAYKTFLLNDYKKNLNNREYAALLDVISGSTPEQIALRYPKLDIDTIAEIAKNYTDIATWGLDDYVPNVEKGRFKIVENKIDEKGKAYQKLVGIGLSERDATRKAVAHLTANPDSGSLSIDTDFKVINDDKTSVSSKQYYAMQNKLAKEIAASVDTIDKAVAKEMAAKTMGKKFTIKPTHAFSEYVQPRRDILKGEEDIFPVLESYAYSLEKKMALDPVIDLVKKDLNKMSAEERKYILDLTDDVKGRYHWEDQIIDQLFGTYRGYSKVVGGARTLEANIKLGWRPIAASINFASGQMHTWVKVGATYYIDGVKLLRSPEGQKMMNEVRPFLGTTLALGEEMRAKTPIWKPLGMFQAVEPLNREVSVAANYLYAKNDLKMSEAAAKEFAIRANWAQQFTYNIANLPKTMRGPTGRLITQFKPYLFKELEFMSNLSGKEWIRYTVMQLALGGPRGALMIMKSLPILAGLGFWEEAMENIEEWMNKEAPVVSRGIGGLPGLIKPEYGIDVSAAATFQFPAEPLDFVGPFLSDLTNLWKQVVVPMSTFGPTVQDAKRLLQPVVVMKYWTRALEYAVSKDNWVLDSHGNKLYEVPSALPFILQSVAGVENIDINRIKAQERILAKRDERTRGLVTRLTNQAMQLILDGKPIPQDLMDRMVKNGVTGDTLVNRVTRSQLPPDIRHILDAAIWQRPEVIRMEPNQSDYTFP